MNIIKNIAADSKKVFFLIFLVFFLWMFLGLFLSWDMLTHIFVPSPAKEWRTMLGDILGCDFVNIWTSARAILDGKDIRSFYDLETFNDIMNGYFSPDIPTHNWGYPPSLLLFTFIFGMVSYFWSYVAWSFAGLAAFLPACRAGIGKEAGMGITWTILFLAALSPASLFNLLNGQNGFITAALFLGGFYLLERREKTAGILFGLLTFKPHLGLLIPLALIVLKKRNAFLSAMATIAVLVGSTMMIWGPAPWVAYLTETANFQFMLLHVDWATGAGSGPIYSYMMPGIYADLHMFMPFKPAIAIHILCAVFIVAFIMIVLWIEGLTQRSVLILALGSVLVPPYGFNYDLVMVAGALAVYLLSLRSISVPRVALLWGPVWGLPLMVFWLKQITFPASSVILLAALCCLVRDVMRDHENSRTNSAASP